MTGYQEILTDPSYAGQIITFTFPHIGNVGTNDEDIETVNMAALSGVRGCVLKTDITEPVQLPRHARPRRLAEGARHHRHRRHRHARADRPHPREGHAQRRHRPRTATATSTAPRCVAEAKAWPGLDGMDLAKEVTTGQTYTWDETSWEWGKGYGRQESAELPRRRRRLRHQAQHPAAARRPRLPRHRGAGDRDRPRTSSPTSPTASSCRTAPAIRRRPATMPCRRSAA